MTMINAYDGQGLSNVGARTRELIAERERLLGPSYRLFYERPVHFVRAEGVWLFDPDGNRYLDAYNNVASVGHCHPHVVDAMCRQAARINTHTRYLDETILGYAARLLATFPAALSQVMFTCTGSEANDLALRIARHATGRQGVIVTANAYHGVTAATAELSPSLGPAVPLGAAIRVVAPPALDDAGGQGFAAGVAAVAERMTAEGIAPAALLVDTIFSSDGVRTDPVGFLAPAATAIRAAGGLFIADEVQPGFGRTGSHFWGFSRHGVVPDMVTMGKPMGNGHPVAAMVARPEVMASFGRSIRYFNTFGGNAVSCAAAGAVLDVIESEGLIANARDTGAHLAERLRAIAARSSAIGAVRGTGLFVAVDLVEDDGSPSPARAQRIVNLMRDRHVLISASGPAGDTLKIRPPLVFGKDHVDQLTEVLEDALANL